MRVAFIDSLEDTRQRFAGANGRPLGWDRSARDIVSTIQAEQDEIIRLDHPEVW